jgi:hypothetical protein
LLRVADPTALAATVGRLLQDEAERTQRAAAAAAAAASEAQVLDRVLAALQPLLAAVRP